MTDHKYQVFEATLRNAADPYAEFQWTTHDFIEPSGGQQHVEGLIRPVVAGMTGQRSLLMVKQLNSLGLLQMATPETNASSRAHLQLAVEILQEMPMRELDQARVFSNLALACAVGVSMLTSRDERIELRGQARKCMDRAVVRFITHAQEWFEESERQVKRWLELPADERVFHVAHIKRLFAGMEERRHAYEAQAVVHLNHAKYFVLESDGQMYAAGCRQLLEQYRAWTQSPEFAGICSPWL